MLKKLVSFLGSICYMYKLCICIFSYYFLSHLSCDRYSALAWSMCMLWFLKKLSLVESFSFWFGIYILLCRIHYHDLSKKKGKWNWFIKFKTKTIGRITYTINVNTIFISTDKYLQYYIADCHRSSISYSFP